MPEHGGDGGATSRLFTDQLAVLREASRLGPVLDLACGAGRHALAGARAGLPMLALDRSAERLAELRAAARAQDLAVPCLRADLEGGAAIPLRPGRLGALLVFRYLHRPLARALVELLAPGGLLLYETFTRAQQARPYGPKSPAFLLEPGELPKLFSALDTLAYEEVDEGSPRPDALARLVARRPRG